MTEPSAEPAGGPAAGLFQFALEGRHAPALFVTGWLGAILGIAFVTVGFLAGLSPGAAVGAVVGLVLLAIGLVLLGGSQAVERTAARLAYPGPSPIVVFAAVLPISVLAAIAVGVPLDLLGVKADRAAGDLVTAAIQAAVFIGVVRLMVIGSGAIRWSDMGVAIGARRIGEALLSGAVFAIPVVVVTAILTSLVVALVGVTPESPLPATGTTSGLVLHLVAGAVIAPLGEEILFRGFAVTAWARSTGPRAAIVRTAILFAVAHVLVISGSTPATATGLAFVGVVARLPVALMLAWVYLRSGTIWAPIGLHAAFNAILLIIAEASFGGLGG